MKNSGYEKSAVFYDYFDTKNNIDFFCSYAINAGEALDIGAGTGRIAIPILKKDVRVYCVEPSVGMIEQFLEKLNDEPELKKKVELVKADASSFKIDRKFKFAYMSGVFDHFLSDEERLEALRNIHVHLEEEGILVFDVFAGLMRTSPLKPAGIHRKGDFEYRRYVGSKIIDEEILEVFLSYEVFDKEKLINKIEEKSFAGIITKERIFQLLEQSRFKVTNVFGSYDFLNIEEDISNELLIIETRKA